MSSEEASPTPDNFQPASADDATRDLLLDLAARRLSDDFDCAAGRYVVRLLAAVDWTGLIGQGVAEALGEDHVLAAVSRMKNTAPPDVSVNAMVEELGRLLGEELKRRVLDRPHTYFESIPVARAAATRSGRESDENRSAEDGGE